MACPRRRRSGWFVESLATQTLVIFAIRTRRIPFFRSRPSMPLTLAALSVVLIGAVLPFTPLAHVLGFQPLPGLFFLALAGMVISYLALIEVGKHWFYRTYHAPVAARRRRTPGHRVRRLPPASPPTLSGHPAGPSAMRPRPPPARGLLPVRELGQTAPYPGDVRWP